VSLGNKGQQARGGYSIFPSISSTGRFVAFQSTARNLVTGAIGDGANIYVRDRQAKKTILVSRGLGGSPINLGSSDPAISADGRFVAFDSNSSNLVPGDTNDIDDVFVYDMQSGKTTRVSVATNGEQGNDVSLYPSISADGRFVVFHSYATNLVPGDTNHALDIFMHDLRTGTTTRISVSSSGAQANDDSGYHFAIAPQGDKVAFESAATNLVPGDTNGQPDIFLRQLDPRSK
jgi:Tol biopolymer transport system component